MNLQFKNFEIRNYVSKILFFLIVTNFIATVDRLEVTLKYYLDTLTVAELHDGEFFWAEVNEGDLNGIFLFAVEKDDKITTDDGSDVANAEEMVLTVPNVSSLNDVEGQEYHVERPIATLRCYFISKPDDVKGLNPLLTHFQNYYKGGILRELGEYAFITNKDYFYYMEFDLSIMAFVDTQEKHASFFENGVFANVDETNSDFITIFKVVLVSRNYNESNFFKIENNKVQIINGDPATAGFTPGTDADDTTRRLDESSLFIDFSGSGDSGYTLFTPSTNAKGGIPTNKITVTGDGEEIEDYIRNLMELEAISRT